MPQIAPVITAFAAVASTGVSLQQAQAQRKAKSRAAAALADSQRKAEALLKQRQAAMKSRRGLESTILTSSLGAPESVTGRPTTLLGGSA